MHAFLKFNYANAYGLRSSQFFLAFNENEILLQNKNHVNTMFSVHRTVKKNKVDTQN
jgi:hypothetical protein